MLVLEAIAFVARDNQLVASHHTRRRLRQEAQVAGGLHRGKSVHLRLAGAHDLGQAGPQQRLRAIERDRRLRQHEL
jgi:hypothetical protein